MFEAFTVLYMFLVWSDTFSTRGRVRTSHYNSRPERRRISRPQPIEPAGFEFLVNPNTLAHLMSLKLRSSWVFAIMVSVERSRQPSGCFNIFVDVFIRSEVALGYLAWLERGFSGS